MVTLCVPIGPVQVSMELCAALCVFTYSHAAYRLDGRLWPLPAVGTGRPTWENRAIACATAYTGEWEAYKQGNSLRYRMCYSLHREAYKGAGQQPTLQLVLQLTHVEGRFTKENGEQGNSLATVQPMHTLHAGGQLGLQGRLWTNQRHHLHPCAACWTEATQCGGSAASRSSW